MTAELWLHRPCEHSDDWLTCDTEDCPGGSRVRLDPNKVVFTIPNDMWGTDDEYTVQDVIDALLEEESRAALDELSRFSEELELYEDELSGDCETDCQEACAYPGQFTECEL